MGDVSCTFFEPRGLRAAGGWPNLSGGHGPRPSVLWGGLPRAAQRCQRPQQFSRWQVETDGLAQRPRCPEGEVCSWASGAHVPVSQRALWLLTEMARVMCPCEPLSSVSPTCLQCKTYCCQQSGAGGRHLFGDFQQVGRLLWMPVLGLLSQRRVGSGPRRLAGFLRGTWEPRPGAQSLRFLSSDPLHG